MSDMKCPNCNGTMKQVECPHCNGGYYDREDKDGDTIPTPCDHCDGTGYVDDFICDGCGYEERDMRRHPLPHDHDRDRTLLAGRRGSGMLTADGFFDKCRKTSPVARCENCGKELHDEAKKTYVITDDDVYLCIDCADKLSGSGDNEYAG